MPESELEGMKEYFSMGHLGTPEMHLPLTALGMLNALQFSLFDRQIFPRV
jgi:hypothetical protein